MHSRERKLRWIKAGLSLYLVFHLLCALVVPNSDNYVGARLSPLITPYAFFFELTNTWNFFAPNTEPPIYVEYELVDEKGDVFRRGRWPEQDENLYLRERQTRRITAADFMVNLEIRAEKMMVAYLCHRSPAPHALRLWRVMETIPRPEEVASGRRKIGDGVGTERKFVSHTYCATELGPRGGA